MNIEKLNKEEIDLACSIVNNLGSNNCSYITEDNLKYTEWEYFMELANEVIDECMLIESGKILLDDLIKKL